MELMQRRRELMAMQGKLDTSPKIFQFNAGIKASNPTGTDPNPGCCVTELCSYQLFTTGSNRTLVTTGAWGNAQGVLTLWRNDAYVDYWGTNSADNYERAVIMRNTNGLRISLNMSRLDDAYALIKETGEILFAGKKSIYYGYTNINDMPSA